MQKMLRFAPAMTALKAGRGGVEEHIADIEATWASDLAGFKLRREAFLLYR